MLASAWIPAPAAADVNIGQVGPPSGVDCNGGFDFVQPEVASGPTYIAPGNGTLASWSTGGWDPGDQLTMKAFRKVGEPHTYEAVGSDGPHTVVAGGPAANVFASNVAVKKGDILGLYSNDLGPCSLLAPSDTMRARSGYLQNGQSGSFDPANARRLNVSALFVYDNTLSLSATRRNRKRGTATLVFEVPNPGELTASGKGAKVARAVPARPTELTIRAKGKKRKKLLDTGKVKLSITILYTPTGGTQGSQTVKVKLRKR
jgi:hypothetical protein